MEKNIIIFGVDMSSSMHIDKKKKDIVIVGEGPTHRLGNTTLRTEARYPINFTQLGKRFVLSLHYNRSKSFLFVNVTKNNSQLITWKKKMFIALSTGLVNRSYYTKCISLRNQKRMIQHTLIN